jgi:tripartite-type tricarboxylate transporter receptor subunit TctC
VHTLLDALNDIATVPERKTNCPMRLPISGCYKIKGVGDVLAGRVELAMLDGATAPAQVAAGKLTLLGRGDALSSRETSPVPTLIEQGAGDLWVDTRFALMAPAATPAATIESVRLMLAGALKKPTVRAQFEQAAYHPMAESHERFSRAITESVEHYRRLAQQAGMI